MQFVPFAHESTADEQGQAGGQLHALLTQLQPELLYCSFGLCRLKQRSVTLPERE